MLSAKKYALVLGGGGAKGAYQIGAWKALKEQNIHFSAVIGTSIGGLNGAFLAQDDYNSIYKIWNGISIDKIVALPGELIKNGEFKLNRHNLKHLKKVQDNFLHNRGLDTTPLKKMIDKYLQEDKIRKSGIDFGIVTYELNNLKPIEYFLEDIPAGQLGYYLLGSASLPGFKATKFKNKVLIDGGVHNNLPYALAKERGYKKIIVIDISGFGRSKKPETEGTETIYIKNTGDLGGTIDFRPRVVKQNMEMGYLDTLKIFQKISGINYYYHKEKKIIKALEKILFEAKVINEYKKYLKDNNTASSIESRIREQLPQGKAKYKFIIPALAECAAESLDLERVKLYRFMDFIQRIRERRMEIKRDGMAENIKSQPFEYFIKSIKEGETIYKLPPYQYNLILDFVFGRGDDKVFYTRALSGLFPELIPAKIFFIILNHYHRR